MDVDKLIDELYADWSFEDDELTMPEDGEFEE